VLMTDGQNNRGAIDPMTGADLARAFGIKVYSVLVGRGGVVPVPVTDAAGAKRIEMVRMDVDEGVMREIAKSTGGRFFRAQDPAALSQIYGEIDRLERAPIRSIVFREYRDLGPQLLALAAAVFGIHLLFSSTFAFRLP
jgi:Ca-activated chloride channel homolog